MPEPIQTIDETILFYIQQHWKNPTLDPVMLLITSLGNAGFLWIAIALILLLQKRHRKCGVTLISSIGLSSLFGDRILKPLFDRIRPCNQFPQVEILLHQMHSPSFPSGHTMVAFASATVIYHYSRPLGIVTYLFASLMAFSRMYLFVHYPTDILGGLVLGILTARIVISLCDKIFDQLSDHPTIPPQT